MTQDLHHFLKEQGYLDSPASRVVWQGFKPTLRGHLRQLILLIALSACPLLLLVAHLTTLHSSDVLILSAIYLVFVGLAVVLVDLLVAYLMWIPPLETLLSKPWVLNVLSGLICLILVGGGAFWLQDAFIGEGLLRQTLHWLGLGLAAVVLASVPRHLVIARLYWHGVRPPSFRRQRWLTALALVLALSYPLGRALFTQPEVAEPPEQATLPKEKIVLLCFDIPLADLELYRASFPEWGAREVMHGDRSITNLWASFGTGTIAHRVSFYQYKTPLFLGKLDSTDPTLRLPLRLLKSVRPAEALAGGERYRKYIWEILDQAEVPTLSLGFWHSFPAQSQHGAVMSERWSFQDNGPDFQTGLEIQQPNKPLTLLHGSALRSLRPLVQREDQAWAQLSLNHDKYALSVAYFPLSDHFESLPEPERRAEHEHLAAYRATQIADLLEKWGPTAQIGIIIASGKDNREVLRPLSLMTSPAWNRKIPISYYDLEIAPRILNLFGLTPDYLMYPPVYEFHSEPRPHRVDYGELPRRKATDDQQDARYYQELKALGYIR